MVGGVPTMRRRWYHVNRQMLPCKFAYFFEYAKEGSHWPYLILFYVSIGLDPAQAGLIGGLRFIGGVLGAPICGWIADRYKKHKSIAIIVCFLAAISNALQPVVASLLGDRGHNTCPATSNVNLTQLNMYPAHWNMTGIGKSYWRGEVGRHYTAENFIYASNSNTKLFYCLLASSLLGAFFDGTTMGFVDSGVLRTMMHSPKHTNIGQHRFFGPPGFGVAAFISSILIDYYPHIATSCYAAIFFNYLLQCMGMALSFHFLFKREAVLSQETLPSPSETQKDVNHIIFVIFKKVETWVFLIIVLFNGVALALAFSFSFLFLKEMNTSSLLLGISMAMNGTFGAIFFVISHRIIDFLHGSLNSMAFSCLCWCLRYLLLAYMNRPYQFLLICMLNGLTCSLFVSAYVDFIKRNFPPEIFTVSCGIAAALYNSGGYFVANILGGKLYNEFGAQKLFSGCSIACACFSMLTASYGIVHCRKEDTNTATNSNTNTDTATDTKTNTKTNCSVTGWELSDLRVAKVSGQDNSAFHEGV